MTRHHSPIGIRIVPGDDRGWSGLTALRLDATREIVAVGTGAEVEAMLRKGLDATMASAYVGVTGN